MVRFWVFFLCSLAFAAQEHGVVFPITTIPTQYSTADNYYDTTASSGVRFSFAAPQAGNYIIKFVGQAGSDFYAYKYTSSAFSSYTVRYNFYSSKKYTYADTLHLGAGDSVFYKITTYNNYSSDSLDTFQADYTALKSYTVTLESSSPKCSTSVAIDTVIEGSVHSYLGYGRAGYRPNGWKLISGSHGFRDSLAYSIKDTILSDTKLQLQCKVASIIDVTDSAKSYAAMYDFYENSPATGMRFRYVAPAAKVYAIRAIPDYLYGYYKLHGADSSFATIQRSYAISYSAASFYVPASAGESFYLSIVPRSSSYFDDSVAVLALPASIVQTEGMTGADTVATGEKLSIAASLDTGYNFAHWTVVSGSGRFLDSTARSTSFIPTSETVTIAAVTKDLPIYPLSDTFSHFTFYANSSQAKSYYGIRTVFDAKDSGMYALIIRTPHYSYEYSYGKDSTFRSYSGYQYCDAGSCKVLFGSGAGTKNYFLLYQASAGYMADSVEARVARTYKVNADTVGAGRAYVGTYSRSYDSSYVAGDSVPLKAASGVNSRFSRWERVSGSCSIADSASQSTYAIIAGDCRVRAVFLPGTIYPITGTPTEYTTAANYYAQAPSYGVRFAFVAPQAGDYAFVFSRNTSNNLYYYRYATADFSSYTKAVNFKYTSADTVSLAAGDSIFFTIKNYYSSDSLEPFWISYSTTKSSLTLTADSNGYTYPSTGYSPAWNGAKYSIRATGKSSYRFSTWKIISGSVTIDNSAAPSTLASVKAASTLKATFKKGEVQKLSTKRQTFNYQTHYYSDYTNSAIRFTWTPPDSTWYVIDFEPIDSLKAIFSEYGNDSMFYTYNSNQAISGSSKFLFKGKAGVPLYWTLKNSSSSEIPNKSFTAQISIPNILTVESGKQGRAYPSGDVYIAPGSDTIIYAVPYGGYTFNSWDSIAGAMTISNLKNSRARISPKTSSCSVRATYVLDFTVEPSLLISNLDLSGYPGICTQVSVTDKNNGRSIFGLDSSNFILFQDKQSLPLQATTIQEISGVSVVLVADESGSMSGTRLVEAKESMRAFIREMGPYDRTAIVGFSGGSDASVKQVMTSDTSLLMKAVNKLTASGTTNINTGALLGVNQIIGETNPTAVIIFSDGANNSDVTSSSSVITLANSLNTSIYSIGLENTDTDPLLYLAEGTGGTYSYAPSGDELASIYATIRSAVQARYVLCYQSPDAVLDGDTHTVVIKTNFLGKNASDTATWQEDFLPPSVRLTEETWNKVGKNQPQKDTLSISVYATSKIPITSVMLYIRKSSTTNAAFSAYSMVHVKDSLWRYIVPASSVLYPGLDFYVVATDSSGFIGKTPAIPTPSKEPYTIPIKNEVPNIELLTLSCSDTIGGSGNILFNITDDDGIYSASIYYKDSLSVLFLEQNMARKSDSSDTWIASIPAEIFKSGEIEYYVRALDTNGASARWLKTKNSTISACKDGDAAPDIKDIITIQNGDSASAAIVRSTKGIGIALLSQDFTPKTDTLKASLSCLVSGDKEDIRLIEKNSGYYETLKLISKNEYSAKKNDGYISCAPSDTLVAEFKDPVYNTISRDTVAFKDSVAYSYRFLETDSIADLDSIETSTSAAFRLRLTATSPTLYKADTLEVHLFTNKGDSLWVKAVETGPYSSIFDCTEKFYFAENQSAIKESHLDAALSLETSDNRVKIQAQIGSDTSSLKSRDSLIIFSNYIPADVAEIYDRDLDGRADSVRIHFVKPLKQKISSIDTVFWNVAGGTRQKVPGKNIKIVGDSSWIEGVLEKPFEYGLTAANKTNQPYLRVTKKDSDLSQKVLLNDKIGAVPIDAEKHPGKASLNTYLEPSTSIPPDTLIVTLSEKIQDSTGGNSWNTLFQYSPTCEDSATYPLKLLKAPELDKSGINWILILKDYSAITGNCIRLNPSAPYRDYYKNNPDRGGVEIKGADGSMYLYDIAANPPISGTGKAAKWIPPEESSLQDVPDTISTVKVLSAAPYTAEIFIYDGLGNFVISITQKFGYHGEMEDPLRGNSENRAKVGYLYWNQRSDTGRKVGNGVYIWRIVFKFEDGHSEYRLLKTGILRKEK